MVRIPALESISFQNSPREEPRGTKPNSLIKARLKFIASAATYEQKNPMWIEVDLACEVADVPNLPLEQWDGWVSDRLLEALQRARGTP